MRVWIQRSTTPLVCGARWRVQMWARCARAENQRAIAVDFMAGPLSETITRGTTSPVAGSVQSTTSGRPSSASAASMAASRAEIRSPAVWVTVTGHARASLAA